MRLLVIAQGRTKALVLLERGHGLLLGHDAEVHLAKTVMRRMATELEAVLTRLQIAAKICDGSPCGIKVETRREARRGRGNLIGSC